MTINVVVVEGNLTKDPELRSTPSGVQVLSFGIAVNEMRRKGDEWVEAPVFADVDMFGNQAARMAEWLTKGMKVVVHGRLRYSSWEQADGTRRSKLSIMANDVSLPPRRRQERQEPGRQSGGCGDAYADEDLVF